jgi:hypothetical protein
MLHVCLRAVAIIRCCGAAVKDPRGVSLRWVGSGRSGSRRRPARMSGGTRRRWPNLPLVLRARPAWDSRCGSQEEGDCCWRRSICGPIEDLVATHAPAHLQGKAGPVNRTESLEAARTRGRPAATRTSLPLLKTATAYCFLRLRPRSISSCSARSQSSRSLPWVAPRARKMSYARLATSSALGREAAFAVPDWTLRRPTGFLGRADAPIGTPLTPIISGSRCRGRRRCGRLVRAWLNDTANGIPVARERQRRWNLTGAPLGP